MRSAVRRRAQMTAGCIAIALGMQPVAQARTPPPGKPIRVIVPVGTGGGLDTIARIVSPKLSAGLGQTIVIDNRPGAGGAIGVELAARAAPDGCTLLMASASYLVQALMYKDKVSYDPLRDFAPISQVAAAPYVLIVTPALAARSVAELIAYAKANAGKLDYASLGNGSLVHLATELFKKTADIDMVHVPYKGMGAILVELLGGQIQVSFSTVIGVLPQVRAQKLRALAVTGAQRAQAAPDLPTMMEAGVAGFSVTQWHGLLAPAGTSSAVVERLNRETVKAVRLPEIAARLASDGTEAIGSSSHKFAEHLAAERNKWARVIAGAGIRAE